MNKQSWLCSACGRTPASNFCSCSGKRETFLCEGCIPSHYTKNPGRLHLCIPVSAYGEHTVPGYFDRLHMRGAQIPLGRDELLANLEAVDACIAEFNSKIETAISTMREYAQTMTAKLQKVRRDLERDISAAVEEVERTMYLDQPRLEKNFADNLRDFGQGCHSLTLFTYQMTECLSPAALDKMLQFQTVDPPLHILPGISNNSLRLYNVVNGQTRRATLSRSFSNGTAYCVVDDTEVLCLGGNPAVAQTYSLSLANYQIREMRPMISARAWPGILKYHHFVYIFGGYVGQKDIAFCEKYNLEHRSWIQLPNMLNPRRAFTPCLYEKEVYLAGVFNSHRVLEVFNLDTDTFRVAPVRFPVSASDSISFISDGVLIIITDDKQMWRWTIGSAETSFQVSNVTKIEGTAVSSCPIVRTRSEVCWVQYDTGDLVSYNLVTKTINKK